MREGQSEGGRETNQCAGARSAVSGRDCVRSTSRRRCMRYAIHASMLRLVFDTAALQDRDLQVASTGEEGGARKLGRGFGLDSEAVPHLRDRAPVKINLTHISREV